MSWVRYKLTVHTCLIFHPGSLFSYVSQSLSADRCGHVTVLIHGACAEWCLALSSSPSTCCIAALEATD